MNSKIEISQELAKYLKEENIPLTGNIKTPFERLNIELECLNLDRMIHSFEYKVSTSNERDWAFTAISLFLNDKVKFLEYIKNKCDNDLYWMFEYMKRYAGKYADRLPYAETFKDLVRKMDMKSVQIREYLKYSDTIFIHDENGIIPFNDYQVVYIREGYELYESLQDRFSKNGINYVKQEYIDTLPEKLETSIYFPNNRMFSRESVRICKEGIILNQNRIIYLEKETFKNIEKWIEYEEFHTFENIDDVTDYLFDFSSFEKRRIILDKALLKELWNSDDIDKFLIDKKGGRIINYLYPLEVTKKSIYESICKLCVKRLKSFNNYRGIEHKELLFKYIRAMGKLEGAQRKDFTKEELEIIDSRYTKRIFDRALIIEEFEKAFESPLHKQIVENSLGIYMQSNTNANEVIKQMDYMIY